MKYPCLVPKRLCKTDAEVIIRSEEADREGDFPELFRAALKCNLQTKAYKTLTPDKCLITLSGKALFSGDICPEVEEISSGTVNIGSHEYGIYKGSKARNPDGTVNFTELELM